MAIRFFNPFQYQRNESLDKHLRCKWLNHEIPYLKLAPFKYEQKHKNPEIAVIHELISKNQAQSIINEASGRMRSTPFTVGAESQGYSKLRTSKVMYMNEKLIPKAMELSKNVELAMRFRLSHERFASENFQIMNYGIGGKISPHIDSDNEGTFTELKNVSLF